MCSVGPLDRTTVDDLRCTMLAYMRHGAAPSSAAGGRQFTWCTLRVLLLTP